MKPFSLLIKPAGADCNLQCEYCFYRSRGALYPATARHRMSDEVLQRLVAGYMATDQPQYVFNWQGGEPTLLGVEFFRRVTELQMRYGKPGAVVANGLQTNATLLDDEFAEHLARYRFLVGVSIDGPAEIHDRYRVGPGGRGSHQQVLRGIECLRRNHVDFNALVLVTSANVGRAKEVYHYLCDLGIRHHQYIPCVEFNPDGRPLPFTITGRQWGEFLCELFDEWRKADTYRVSVRLFDSIVTMMVEGRHNVCHMGTNCCEYFVVEHNGDVYPCDFFVERELLLGNICSDSWESLQTAGKYVEFGRQKARWNSKCSRCDYLRFCAGDCLKHRLYNGDNPRTLSWLCEGWMQFYGHALGPLSQIASDIARERQRGHAVNRSGEAGTVKVGRNDPCPCGSGKKFKHCCGAHN